MNRKGICHDCEYRHCSCDHPRPWETNELCKHWRLGKCYMCKHYKEDMTEEETDEWFKRGCEGWFPTAKYCSKFKRDWKKTIKEMIAAIKSN